MAGVANRAPLVVLRGDARLRCVGLRVAAFLRPASDSKWVHGVRSGSAAGARASFIFEARSRQRMLSRKPSQCPVRADLGIGQPASLRGMQRSALPVEATFKDRVWQPAAQASGGRHVGAEWALVLYLSTALQAFTAPRGLRDLIAWGDRPRSRQRAPPWPQAPPAGADLWRFTVASYNILSDHYVRPLTAPAPSRHSPITQGAQQSAPRRAAPHRTLPHRLAPAPTAAPPSLPPPRTPPLPSLLSTTGAPVPPFPVQGRARAEPGVGAAQGAALVRGRVAAA